MMVAAGFDTVFIGIETPEEKSLKECGKTQNRGRDIVADVRRIHQAGIQVQGGFIVGFDNDVPTTFDQQVAMIQKSGIVTAMVGLLQALPGTRLFSRMKQEGRLSGATTGDNVDGTTNMIPKMSLEALQKATGEWSVTSIRRLSTTVASRPSSVTTAAGRRSRTTMTDIMAFVRTVPRLGIFGPERFQYWRLLLRTLLREPRKLSLAVTLAIYGHHFRRVCETHIA